MKLKRPKRSARQRALDGAVSCYAQWHGECAAVRNAYRRWLGASPAERRLAFYAYNAALDREEYAARCYARASDHKRGQ